MQVVILAGGAGTRLKSVTGDLPKALADVAGAPLVFRQIRLAAASGANRVTIVTGYGADTIRATCGSGEKFGVAIDYVVEPVPMGTAGAILAGLDAFDDDFIVLYGDVVLDVDLARLWARHLASGADATLFVHPNDHPADSDLVDATSDGTIRGFHPYPHPPGRDYANLVNAGLYVLRRDSLAGLALAADRLDFGKHVFPAMIAAARRLHAYRSPEYIKDAGTPERIREADEDIESGRVARMSLRQPAPAVFLDRDGVINEERNRVARAAEMELIPGSATAIHRINRSGLRAIIVTNQAVLARGDCDENELARIHARMDMALAEQGAFVDALYYCPHHPDGGFPGEVARLKIVCDCRKPAPGMVEQATRDLNVDIENSWMIGDSTSDMELARRTGLRSILVATGQGGRDGLFPGRPDFTTPDLAAAVDFILDGWPRLEMKAQRYATGIPAGALALIGGLAHSGKSSFASALAIALRQRGQSAVTISLDNWLRPEGERGPGVLGRYDITAAVDALTRLLDSRSRVMAPHYDPMGRTSQPDTLPLEARPEDVIIVEGIPALTLTTLVKRAALRLFLRCAPAQRRARFDMLYSSRGLAERERNLLYDQRDADETPVVTASAVAADATVDLES